MTAALEYFLADNRPLRGLDGTPFSCYDCPFGTAQMKPYPPNPDDPDEGYYHCTLLNIWNVWGETPKCTAKDWRARARAELRELLEPRP